jgi:hypothetical protein
MNVPALLIAVGFGAAFFVAEQRYYYPTSLNVDVMSFFSTEHSKARAAVRRVLIDPDSAEFSAMRSVQAGENKYVCGGVMARDKTGKLSSAAFVYAATIDFARLDDGGRITRQISSFSPCPSPAGEQIKQPDLTISPGALAVVKGVQKYVPKADERTALATLGQLASSAAESSTGGGSADGTMERQSGQLPARTAVSASPGEASQASSPGTVGRGATVALRADQPQAAWPTFPEGHALTKATRQRSAAEALAMAQDVEDRWKRAGDSAQPTMRPSSEEIEEASRALLTIDPKAPEYNKAWAAFVRLQELDRKVAKQ